LPLIIAARAAVCGALIASPEGVDPYGRVYDPLVALGWIAGWTERIGLGTSIVLVPLHNPSHTAAANCLGQGRHPVFSFRASSTLARSSRRIAHSNSARPISKCETP
jgi:hypothetical protein